MLLVLGSTNTDLVIRGPRLPRPGETVLGGNFYQAAGGKGANQAVAAARAGGRVVFLSAVGDDPFGSQALEGFARESIDARHVKVVPGAASGVALILVDQAGWNCISVAPGANALLSAADIEQLPESLFQEAKLLLASLEVPVETVAAAFRRARTAGRPTILNPAPVAGDLISSGLMELADLIVPNETEASQLSGIEVENIDSAVAAARKIQSLGCRQVIVTLGSLGCVVVERDADHLQAREVRAIDSTAAGDCFCGVLAVALSEGRSLIESARWATAAAAISVGRPGAQPSLPMRAEFDATSGGS